MTDRTPKSPWNKRLAEYVQWHVVDRADNVYRAAQEGGSPWYERRRSIIVTAKSRKRLASAVVAMAVERGKQFAPDGVVAEQYNRARLRLEQKSSHVRRRVGMTALFGDAELGVDPLTSVEYPDTEGFDRSELVGHEPRPYIRVLRSGVFRYDIVVTTGPVPPLPAGRVALPAPRPVIEYPEVIGQPRLAAEQPDTPKE